MPTQPSPSSASSHRSSLAAEIGKKLPFDSPEQEAHLNVLRSASVLSGPFERLFDTVGLSESTYNALRILRGAGEQGRLCGEIGAMLIARVPDVTRLVDRLEKAGLADRRKSSTDRRAVHVHITRKGLKLLAELDKPLDQLHKQQLGHMSRKDLTELNRLLALARTPPAAR